MKIFREITPLMSADVYVLLDSVNKGFDYPIHNHPEYEINLVTRASGQRVVGDSTEVFYEEDLAFIGPYLFHKWDDSIKAGTPDSPCRVITIQFDMHLFEASVLSRRPFFYISELLRRSHRGLAFHGADLRQASEIMHRMTDAGEMEGVVLFLQLLDLLARAREVRPLASEGFEFGALHSRSKRLHVAYQYVIKHFTRHELNLGEVAEVVNLSDSAFSHFFRKCTNKSFTQFLIGMRLGYACKLLINTDDLISDVCYQSGFNNVANFNRLFKKYHGCTPQSFRTRYQDRGRFDWTEQHTPGQFLPPDRRYRHVPRPDTYATRIIHS